jgi:alginate O-acetyltransferase complex protein AlgI
VMFYPQLAAGPIERPQKLLPQFYQKHEINYGQIASGLKLMLFGFLMKTVIADRLAIYVDYVFKNPGVHSRLALITAVVFYSFQIYCDFAGYSFIALGTAKTMGFELSTNFNRPYLAVSGRDFWKRWNITLSRWFRDYVYLPMGGNRVVVSKYIFNILVVFILSGLWHGANWTFIVWGILHAIFFLAGYFRTRFFPGMKPPRLAVILLTFLAVSFFWIFFRSQSVHEALLIVKRIFSPQTAALIGGEFDERSLLICSVLGIALIITTDIMMEFFPGRFQLMHNRRSWIRLATVAGMILLILTFGVFDGSQFIYFQF